MVVRINVHMTDDLDGVRSDDVSTVSFGLDGVYYEIDLSREHEEQLRSVLAPYLPAARRVEFGVGASYSTRDDLMARIRAWARAQGFGLCDRGRIPLAAVAAFRAAYESCPDVTQLCDGLLEPLPEPE